MAKLKVAGTWSGVLESIDLENWTVAMLRKEGVKNNAKILSSRVATDEGKALYDQMMAEEERSSRITRLKAAAEAVAKRNTDGSLPISDFNLELENQSGETVELGSETDQQINDIVDCGEVWRLWWERERVSDRTVWWCRLWLRCGGCGGFGS
ncbi:hypothetical protein ACFE04_002005 [Oxalis oulophora]